MLSALFRTPSSPDESRGWEWFSNPTPTWAGMTVDRDTSMQLVTVYGCVRMIADAIATLPVDTFKRWGDGRTEQITTPRHVEEPSTELDSVEWRTQILSSLLLAGNSFEVLTRDRDGNLLEQVPIDPDKVHVERRGANRSRRVYVVDGVDRPDLEIRHIKGIMLPGADVGMSPVEAARQTIGLGLAATRYGAEFFTNEGNMPGVIELPRPAQGETMRSIARQWQARRQAGGRGMPGVLPDGAQWKMTGVTSEQAQFLGTRKFSASEIAGQMFLIDPTDLGIPIEGSSITYANLEQRNARRVQVTFLPWIVRIEKALSATLPRGQFVKLNVNALLRGDSRTRWGNYKTAEDINTSAAARGDVPVLSTQEMRDLEEFGPAPEAPEPPEQPAPPPAPEAVG